MLAFLGLSLAAFCVMRDLQDGIARNEPSYIAFSPTTFTSRFLSLSSLNVRYSTANHASLIMPS